MEIAEFEARITPRGWSETRAEVAATQQSFSPLQARLVSLQAAFDLTARVGRFAFATIESGARQVLGAAMEVESLRTRLHSLMGSEQAAGAAWERMARIAATTPFELRSVVEAGVTLEAFGAKSDETLKKVADLAAFMGTDVTEAASAFGRAWAGGVGAADILRERGILNLVKMKSGIDDLTRLSLPEFRKKLLEVMDMAPVVGSTERLSRTFGGLISNLKDEFFNASAAIGNTIVQSDAMQSRGRQLTGVLHDVAERTQQWVDANRDLIDAKLTDFLDNLPDALERIATAAKNVGTAFADMWGPLQPLMRFFAQHPAVAGVMLGGAMRGNPMALAGLAGGVAGSMTVSELNRNGIYSAEGAGRVFWENLTQSFAERDRSLAEQLAAINERNRTPFDQPRGTGQFTTTGQELSAEQVAGMQDAAAREAQEAYWRTQANASLRGLGLPVAPEDVWQTGNLTPWAPGSEPWALPAGLSGPGSPLQQLATDWERFVAAGGTKPQMTEELEKFVAKLRDDARPAVEEYKAELAKLDAAYAAGGVSAAEYGRLKSHLSEEIFKTAEAAKKEAAEQKRLGEEVERIAEAYRREDRARRDAAQRIREQTFPEEAARSQFTELQALVSGGYLAPLEANARVEQIVRDLDTVRDHGTSVMEELARATEGFGRRFSRAMAEMVGGAKLSWRDMLRSLVVDLAEVAIHKSFTEKIVGGLEDAFKAVDTRRQTAANRERLTQFGVAVPDFSGATGGNAYRMGGFDFPTASRGGLDAGVGRIIREQAQTGQQEWASAGEAVERAWSGAADVVAGVWNGVAQGVGGMFTGILAGLFGGGGGGFSVAGLFRAFGFGAAGSLAGAGLGAAGNALFGPATAPLGEIPAHQGAATPWGGVGGAGTEAGFLRGDVGSGLSGVASAPRFDAVYASPTAAAPQLELDAGMGTGRGYAGGGDTFNVTVNAPVKWDVTATDPRDFAAQLDQQMPRITRHIHASIERGGDLAVSVRRRKRA